MDIWSVTEKWSIIGNHPCCRLQKWPWFSTPLIQATCNVTWQLRKGLRGSRDSSRLTVKLFPCMKPIHKEWERWLFFHTHKSQQKTMRHTKNQRNKIKLQKPTLNKQIFINHISHKKLTHRIYNEFLEFDNKKIKQLD